MERERERKGEGSEGRREREWGTVREGETDRQTVRQTDRQTDRPWNCDPNQLSPLFCFPPYC